MKTVFNSKQRSLADYLLRAGFSKVLKSLVFAALISLIIVLLNMFVSSKRLFETQLEAAANVYRSQILAGDLKRTQLVLQDILAVGSQTTVEFLDENSKKLLPDLENRSGKKSWFRIKAKTPVFFDKAQTSLVVLITAEQDVSMNWFLFISTFFALLVSQILSGYFVSSALREVGRDLSERLKILARPGMSFLATDEVPGVISEIDDISNFLLQSQERLVEIQTTFKSPEEMRRFAHDLRSPLSAISMALGTIDNLSAPAKRLMDSAFLRMNSMTTNLLAPLSEADLSLGQQLENLLIEKRYEHKERNLVWNLEINTDTSMNKHDTTEILRSVSNILNNSAEASPEFGVVSLKLYSDGSVLAIEVHDQGQGIPESLQEKILGGGFTTKALGHGIGLSAADRFIKTVGGDLSFEKPEFGGFIVGIKIPKKAYA